MTIETKFDINSLVTRKFDTDRKDSIGALEVMEIEPRICYGGTQVFYLCRPVMAQKEFEHSYKNEGRFNWRIHHGISTEHDFSLGWRKYREDELNAASQNTVDIITGKISKGIDGGKEESPKEGGL